jgi:deazaflavin-dependent oxidoreductase (nitroreductase family)
VRCDVALTNTDAKEVTVSQSRGPTDFNQQIIEEFRANDGKVGGYFEGAPMILIHHIGAHSGTERINPLVYLPDGDDLVIAATKGGSPTNPDWYHNLKAHPRIAVERGRDLHRGLPRGHRRRSRRALASAGRDASGFRRVRNQDDACVPDVPVDPAELSLWLSARAAAGRGRPRR